MVIGALSLRAVFKKESWMFCAGFVVSIADLLFSVLQLGRETVARPEAP
jgi:hypothetical protein